MMLAAFPVVPQGGVFVIYVGLQYAWPQEQYKHVMCFTGAFLALKRLPSDCQFHLGDTRMD